MNNLHKGRRVYFDEENKINLQPCDYAKVSDVHFIINTPNGIKISIKNHTVIEHDDGTITVSPSIIAYPDCEGRNTWHGYIENGNWREV